MLEKLAFALLMSIRVYNGNICISIDNNRQFGIFQRNKMYNIICSKT